MAIASTLPLPPQSTTPLPTTSNNCRMRTSPHLESRKRQRADQHPFESDGSSEVAVKRQRIGYPENNVRPPAFWDGLSTVPLTRGALKELDRRNHEAHLSSTRSARKQSRRPVTRRRLSEWKARQVQHRPTTQLLDRIKPLARQGGLDLSDLRGFPEPSDPLRFEMNSNLPSSRGQSNGTKDTTNTKTTKSTGPYDRAFQQNLTDAGVYPISYRYPDGRIPSKPANWTEIQKRLAQPRPSLSPTRFSDQAHADFVQAAEDAVKEKQVTTSVIPIIEGKIHDSKCVAGGIPFTNLAHLTDGNLVPGNPDIYYGARPEQLSRKVRDELCNYIIPSTQHDLPILPNFSMAVKGSDGSPSVAKRQACYDGALGARSMHTLHAYAEDGASQDENAYAITSIYHDGHLKMYTSHRIQTADPGAGSEYIMTQINTWGMTGNPDTFRQGAAGYRNLRDWAKEQRNKAINKANAKFRTLAADNSTSNISSVSLVSSFATQEEETHTTNTEDETVRSFVQEDVSTVNDLEDSENSLDEVDSNRSLPLKRSSEPIGRNHPNRNAIKRKRM